MRLDTKKLRTLLAAEGLTAGKGEEILRSSFLPDDVKSGTKLFLAFDTKAGQYVVRSKFEDYYRSAKGLEPNSPAADKALAVATKKFESGLKGKLASSRVATKKTTLSAELKLKDGTLYPKGSRAEVFFSERDPTISEVEIEGRKVRLRTTSLHKYLRGFPKPPSTRALQKMDSNASGSTVTGVRNVEMDGHGPDGSPSWMLAMGLI